VILSLRIPHLNGLNLWRYLPHHPLQKATQVGAMAFLDLDEISAKEFA
jgi:hypothetical protein